MPPHQDRPTPSAASGRARSATSWPTDGACCRGSGVSAFRARARRLRRSHAQPQESPSLEGSPSLGAVGISEARDRRCRFRDSAPRLRCPAARGLGPPLPPRYGVKARAPGRATASKPADCPCASGFLRPGAAPTPPASLAISINSFAVAPFAAGARREPSACAIETSIRVWISRAIRAGNGGGQRSTNHARPAFPSPSEPSEPRAPEIRSADRPARVFAAAKASRSARRADFAHRQDRITSRPTNEHAGGSSSKPRRSPSIHSSAMTRAAAARESRPDRTFAMARPSRGVSFPGLFFRGGSPRRRISLHTMLFASKTRARPRCLRRENEMRDNRKRARFPPELYDRRVPSELCDRRARYSCQDMFIHDANSQLDDGQPASEKSEPT